MVSGGVVRVFSHLGWPCVLLFQAAALDLRVQLLTLRVYARAGGVEEPAAHRGHVETDVGQVMACPVFWPRPNISR